MRWGEVRCIHLNGCELSRTQHVDRLTIGATHEMMLSHPLGHAREERLGVGARLLPDDVIFDDANRHRVCVVVRWEAVDRVKRLRLERGGMVF